MESPRYVMENDIPLNYDYYAHHVYLPAMYRIFASIVGYHSFDHIKRFPVWTQKHIDDETKAVIKKNRKVAKDIICADGVFDIKHKVVKIVQEKGGIAKFFKIKAKCVWCKRRLKGKTFTPNKLGKKKRIANRKKYEWVCGNCKYKKIKSILPSFMETRNKINDKKIALNMTCAACQKDNWGVFKCKNHQCSVFWEQLETDNDLEDIDLKLMRLAPRCGSIKKLLTNKLASNI